MQVVGCLIFAAIGLVQWAACVQGLELYFGIPTILAVILSFFLTWVPLLGQIAGIYGAVYAWQWPWWGAAILFFGMYILPLFFGAAAVVQEWFGGHR